jgi:hypothetical protein
LRYNGTSGLARVIDWASPTLLNALPQQDRARPWRRNRVAVLFALTMVANLAFRVAVRQLR